MKKELNNPKNIETDFLKIRGNCLEFKDTIIQLSNISLFSSADIAPDKFPIWSIVLILIGIVLLKSILALAVILIVIGGSWIYYWYSSVQEEKKMTRLTIVTNYGNVFPIIFHEKRFMSKVTTTMKDIIREPVHERNITINVKECSFFDDSSVVKDLYE